MSEAEGTFGSYTLLECLGAGGMAVTYRARERIGGIGDRVVALKQILPSFAKDEAFRRMFLDEARLSAQLSHQNICRTYTAGEIDDTLFISMEYIEGIDLWELMERGCKLPDGFPLAHALHIIEQVALGLHAAHTATSAEGLPLNLVHRDISPQNIRISRTGESKVIDFGVAKAITNHSQTKAGIVKGKVLYLSPEQLEGKLLDGRSDLFALGLILYELVTGTHPLKADSEVATVFNYYNKAIPRPEEVRPNLPERVGDLVVKALAKNRDQRFSDAREMARAVGDALFDVYPSYKPYLLEDFVTWTLEKDAADLEYVLPVSKSVSLLGPSSPPSTDPQVNPTTDPVLTHKKSARSTVVEAQLPDHVKAKAAALFGEPKGRSSSSRPPPSRGGEPTGPSSPLRGPSGAVVPSAPPPLGGASHSTPYSAASPPGFTHLALEPPERGNIWKSLAVAAIISAIAGIWILALMVLSSA